VQQLCDLAVQTVRFVDECQAGVVACEFVDAHGHRHTLIDKVPIFSLDSLDADSQYPQPGYAECTVLRTWRDANGRALVAVGTVESTDGLTEFVVLRTQVMPPDIAI